MFFSWVKVSTWFFTTFSVPGMKEKVHYLDSLHQLFTCIRPEQIDIPPFVLEYDARVRGPPLCARFKRLNVTQTPARGVGWGGVGWGGGGACTRNRLTELTGLHSQN